MDTRLNDREPGQRKPGEHEPRRQELGWRAPRQRELKWRKLARPVRAAAVAACAIFAALLGSAAFNTVFGFVDTAWNGSFIDWITPQFLNLSNLNEFGIFPELVLDVQGVKFFFLELGICVVIALVAVCALTWVASTRWEGRRERREAARILRTYMAHDLEVSEAFPAGWEELALVAADVKSASKDQARRLEDEAARKNDLITYLAHDLKTPLTSVIGYLSLLDEIPEMPLEQRARYVGIALDKARRLERLINEFFDITRYNLQHIELEVEPVNLSFLLVQMADEFYPLLAEHGNTVELTVEGVSTDADAGADPDAELPEITLMADPERLARVLNNVLRNAISYSSEGTKIEVSAQTIARMGAKGAETAGVSEQDVDEQDAEAAGAVRIEVSDTGATIPPHRLEAIFDKFFRLDDARATTTGGAGLGLAIAREIVGLHHGTIRAASEAGRTTFTIELPLS